MRFDMHCHTKEGSLDGKIPITEYAEKLKSLGYDGMLVTDHNSYKGYRTYLRQKKEPAFKDFTVLKGIEYDTRDGGHILVIMPTNTPLPILEIRGLPVILLIEIVHAFGGILGPAHPCGEKYLGITNCKYYQRHPEVIKEFDFIETFNSCITLDANKQAEALAKEYRLPGTGGTDAHKIDCVGLAYTDIDADIKNESDLIYYLLACKAALAGDKAAFQKNGILSKIPFLNPSVKIVEAQYTEVIKNLSMPQCGGSHYPGTSRDHLGIVYDILLWAFNKYNTFTNWYRRSKRRLALSSLLDRVNFTVDPIDYDTNLKLYETENSDTGDYKNLITGSKAS